MNKKRQQNAILEAGKIKTDIAHTESMAVLDAYKQAVLKMESDQNECSKVLADALCLHCHNEDCQNPVQLFATAKRTPNVASQIS